MLGQLLLPMADRDQDALAAARIRLACKAVARELGHKVVAEMWGCDEATVSLKLDEKNRNAIKPAEMVALKRADLRGAIEAAEQAELHRPVDAAEVVRRVPGVLRELFAEELAELVERKLGIR